MRLDSARQASTDRTGWTLEPTEQDNSVTDDGEPWPETGPWDSALAQLREWDPAWAET